MTRIGDPVRTDSPTLRPAGTPAAPDTAEPTATAVVEAPARPAVTPTDFTAGTAPKASVAVIPPALPTGRPGATPVTGLPQAPTTQRPLRPVTYYRHGPTRDDVLRGKDLDVGAYGPAVTDVQHRLNAIGMKLPDGSRFAQDGKFGPKTQAALKEFQQKNGLEPSGRITKETVEGWTPKRSSSRRCRRRRASTGPPRSQARSRRRRWRPCRSHRPGTLGPRSRSCPSRPTPRRWTTRSSRSGAS